MSQYYALPNLPDDFELRPGVTVGALVGILGAVAADMALNTLYSVKVHLEAHDNELLTNSLFYRWDNIGPWDNPFVGCDHLAYQIEQEVLPRLAACLPATALIKKVSVMAYSPLFELRLLAPYELGVNVRGQVGNNVDLKSERMAANMRFNLWPNGFTQYIQQLLGLLPHSGRIYVGPLDISQVAAGETLDGNHRERFNDLGAKLADPLANVSPAGNFVPVRVARHGFTVPVIGRVNIYTGWCDVLDCVPQSEIVFLRSRDS